METDSATGMYRLGQTVYSGMPIKIMTAQVPLFWRLKFGLLINIGDYNWHKVEIYVKVGERELSSWHDDQLQLMNPLLRISRCLYVQVRMAIQRDEAVSNTLVLFMRRSDPYCLPAATQLIIFIGMRLRYSRPTGSGATGSWPMERFPKPEASVQTSRYDVHFRVNIVPSQSADSAVMMGSC